jgi:hypothetical protein
MVWKESDFKHIQFLCNQIADAHFNVKGAELGTLLQSLQWLVTLKESIKLKLNEKPVLNPDSVKPIEPEVKE